MASTVAVLAALATAPAAFAGVGFGVTPTFPTNVTVGQTGLPASLQISNASTPPESAGNVTVNSISLVPACATTSFANGGDCQAASADPGVFQLSPTGTGEAGTACAGQTFTIAIIDPATGQVSFTPIGGPVVLTPPATTNSVCRIDFTFSVLKAPTKPAGTSPPNTVKTAQIGFAVGTAAIDGNDGTGRGASTVTVALTTPTMTTTASGTVTLGGQVTDTAHLTGASAPAPAPTGTITFSLYGSNDATCAGPVAFTSAPVAVNAGSGSYPSAPFTPTAVGTYRWTAAYSGDANNAPVATACNDPNESVVVSSATGGPAPTSTAVACSPSTVRVAQPTVCTAVVTGSTAPTGTVKFASNSSGAFSAPGATCTLAALNASQAGCSVTYTPRSVGSGTHKIYASYAGDANNAASHSATTVTVRSAQTTTSVSCAPTAVAVGAATTCTAIVTGPDPTGLPPGVVEFATNGSGAFSSTSCPLVGISPNQSSCSVTYTPSSIGSGTHKIYAAYPGSGIFQPSHASTTITVT